MNIFEEDPAESNEASCNRHPVEDIEPEQELAEGYQIASRRFARILDQMVYWVMGAPDPKLAMLQVAFACGSSATSGASMNHFGEVMGYTRAAISKGAKSFQRANGIAPIRGTQKDTEACQNYSKIRLAQLHDR